MKHQINTLKREMLLHVNDGRRGERLRDGLLNSIMKEHIPFVMQI